MRRKELGGFSGDTQIWCKIDGKVNLYTFKELSDKFDISYGETDLVDANISVLTVQSDKQVVWHKVLKFIKNKNEFLYETTINGHKTFVHDGKHSFILSSMSKKLIKDCKKNATILTSYYMNEYMTVVKNKYYYYGFIYGAWMGSYNTRNEKQIIVADNLEKASLIADAMNKAKIEYNLITDYEKILYTFTFEPFDIFLEDENFLAGLIAGVLTIDGIIYEAENNHCSIRWNTHLEKNINIFKYAMFGTGIALLGREKNDLSAQFVINKETCSLLFQLDLPKQYMDMIRKSSRSPVYKREVSKVNVRKVKMLKKIEDTYNFRVNGRIIATPNFILTSDCVSAQSIK